MKVWVTTSNGKLSGRASRHYLTIREAELHAKQQNLAAKDLGISARYTLLEFDEDIYRRSVDWARW